MHPLAQEVANRNGSNQQRAVSPAATVESGKGQIFLMMNAKTALRLDAVSIFYLENVPRRQLDVPGMLKPPPIVQMEAWSPGGIASLVLLFLVWVQPTTQLTHIIAVFETPNATVPFSHLAVDSRTGEIYAGARNRLYQLNHDLRLSAQVVTGPVNDSHSCYATGCEDPSHPLTSMDNFNKILLIDYDNGKLISCGSVLQGACSFYRLGNISSRPEFIPQSVAANDPHLSTFAFIGPEAYTWDRSNVLYVGTTFTPHGGYRHDVPALSSRRLDNLDYAEYSFSKQSLLTIEVKYRDHFLVNYVYGFNHSDFAYFLTVQKRSYLPGDEEKGYISRLSRVCVSDPNYDSYTEVTLQCMTEGGENYNLVRAARVVEAAENLAQSLNIAVGDPVLLAAFAPSQGHTDRKQDKRSALCVYSLKDIHVKFNENIHMCFNGSMKYRNMEYISGLILDGKCPKAGYAAEAKTSKGGEEKAEEHAALG
ncbi:unnamed protein product, partial [Cyprideis torosa]